MQHSALAAAGASRGAIALLTTATLALLAACSTPAPIVVSEPRPLPPPIAAEPPAPRAQLPAPAPRPLRRPPPRRPGKYFRDDGPGDNPPPGLASTPDAVPRIESVSVTANQPYAVFGRRYVPMTRLEPFHQRGMASWYGRKFHGRSTALGEKYNMYGMTAAHPTLPLPCFVRVTSLANRRSVIVRVNDRGPFLNGRAIDLSYTAALKLGYSEAGSTEVEVELVAVGDFPQPGATTLAANAASGTPARHDPVVKGLALTSDTADSTWLQVASYGSAQVASAALEHLERELELERGSLSLAFDGSRYRVQLGPFPDRAAVEAARRDLGLAVDDAVSADAAGH